jgi:uncharacterized GH25 family protein
MKRWAMTAAALLAVSGAASAHDFWLEVPHFAIAAGQASPLRFMVGDGPEAGDWELLWRKVISLRDYGPVAVTDLMPAIRPTAGGVPGRADMVIAGGGTHIVAFETAQAMSDLPAAQFNDYIVHEGLNAVVAHRRATGQDGANGREQYSRRAKLLLQVGDATSDQILRPIGQTLEITPERHPYKLGKDRRLPVQVRFRGAPLAGANVRLVRLDGGDDHHGTQAVTDAEGRATFVLADQGRWRIATVWSVPVDTPQADYDTIFASLSFGVEP